MNHDFQSLNAEDLKYLQSKVHAKKEDLETKIFNDTENITNREQRTDAENAELASIQVKLDQAQAVMEVLRQNATEEDVGNMQSVLDQLQTTYNQKLAELSGLTPRQIEMKKAEIAAMEAEKEAYRLMLEEIETLIAA